ncbi:MAG: lycopene cyclase family protein, partial [Bacteroidota bacterium]
GKPYVYKVSFLTGVTITRHKGHLIYIGLGGGYARPSTGYTFYNMQRQLATLAKALAEDFEQLKVSPPWSSRHMLYDSTLLHILQAQHLRGADLFPDLFRRNPTERVLDFLNGETHLLDELRLMSTTNIPVFARAFVQELIKS